MAFRKVLHLPWLKAVKHYQMPPVRSYCKSMAGFSESDWSGIRQQLSQYKGGSIDLSTDGATGLASVIINNPEKMNAISGSMMVQLEEVVSELELWKLGKGVLLHGSDGNFCTGGDLTFMKNIANPSDGSRMSGFMHQVTQRFANLPLLSISLVQGRALGGGAELAIVPDFCCMTESAAIGFVQIRLGIMPGWGATTRIVKKLGRTKALRILTSGHIFNSEEALDIGICDFTVQDDSAIERARSILLEHSKGPLAAMHAIKQAVTEAHDENMESALKNENTQFTTVWGGSDHHAALDKDIKHR